MKRLMIMLCCLLLTLSASCSRQPDAGSDEPPPEVLHAIQIFAGETELSGVLYDNSYGRAFSACLPITVSLWVPADFAKAFSLDRGLEGDDPVTRRYEAGGIAYWPDGAAVAIFHAPDRDKTAVPIVHIGKLDEGEALFADYAGEITITRAEEE